MARAAERHGAAALAPDGVHPSALGHDLRTDAWLTALLPTADRPAPA